MGCSLRDEIQATPRGARVIDVVPLRAVDVCCGAGGLSDGMAAAGFDVLGVDVVRRPEYRHRLLIRDLRELTVADLGDGRIDWLHGSPPCGRFSLVRGSRGIDPPTLGDLDLLLAFDDLRREASPRSWTVENVRGAVPHFTPVLGPPALVLGPFVWWGTPPPFLGRRRGHRKSPPGTGAWSGGVNVPGDPWLRARMPFRTAYPLAVSMRQGLQAPRPQA